MESDKLRKVLIACIGLKLPHVSLISITKNAEMKVLFALLIEKNIQCLQDDKNTFFDT